MSLTLEGTLLTAAVDDRILTYRLLPYGEAGRTNKGKVTVARGVLSVAPVESMIANMEHDRTRPVARFVSVTDAGDGLDAALRIAKTRQGDDLLTEAAEGLRTGISVEVADPIIRGGQMLAGMITGAGFVTAPAFASAQLVAADAGEIAATTATTAVRDTIVAAIAAIDDAVVPDVAPTDQVIADRDALQVALDEIDAALALTTPVDAPPTVPTTPTPGSTGDSTMTASTTATAPAGMRRTATAAPADRSFGEVIDLMASAYKSQDPTLFAALSDIKVSGAGAVGVGLLQPQWVSELWSGRQYARKFVPLMSSAPLTGMTVKGWRWLVKPEMADYAGNKAAVPSNAPTTEAVDSVVSRLAGAHDIDRAFRDFAVTEFWDSYFRAMTESYARKSDLAGLAALVAGATPVVGQGNLAATTVWSQIVDGALAVIAGGGTPSFAVVGLDLYRAALLTPQFDLITLLNASLGLEEGTVSNFKVLPEVSLAGKALVGAREASTFRELGETPIRVEGIDMIKGGIDPGVFGYYSTTINDADALALVSKPVA